jgi:hypothetical protein
MKQASVAVSTGLARVARESARHCRQDRAIKQARSASVAYMSYETLVADSLASRTSNNRQRGARPAMPTHDVTTVVAPTDLRASTS